MSKQPSFFAMSNLILSTSRRPNKSTHHDGYRLSYNPYCADTDTDETAIVIAEEYFLILDGDHCEALDGKTLTEAKAYWASLPHLHGGTSNTLADLDSTET